MLWCVGVCGIKEGVRAHITGLGCGQMMCGRSAEPRCGEEGAVWKLGRAGEGPRESGGEAGGVGKATGNGIEVAWMRLGELGLLGSVWLCVLGFFIHILTFKTVSILHLFIL